MSLREFSEEMPSPRALYLDDESGYLLWLGPTKNNLASGPSVYVFDEDLRLLDWSATTGDGERIKGLDGRFDDRRSVTIEDVLD